MEVLTGKGRSRRTAQAGVRRSAFTLIELLVVISVMSMLGLIIIGGSRMLLQTARERRSVITREALRTALHRYRTDYQHWPVSPSDKKFKSDSKSKDDDGFTWYKWDSSNYLVFDALRTGNEEGNPDDLRFIDETVIYTTDTGDSGGKLVTLSKAGAGLGKSFFYAMKRDNKPAPFTVEICFDLDECRVGPDYFAAGAESDANENYGY